MGTKHQFYELNFGQFSTSTNATEVGVFVLGTQMVDKNTLEGGGAPGSELCNS